MYTLYTDSANTQKLNIDLYNFLHMKIPWYFDPIFSEHFNSLQLPRKTMVWEARLSSKVLLPNVLIRMIEVTEL